MLQSIRERTQGWIAGVIITLLIISFALWGLHSYLDGGGNNQTIAEVNGVSIQQTQINLAYDRLRRQMTANDFTAQREKFFKEQVLQALILTQVLKQGATKEGFRVSVDQIDNALQGIPEFQVNGEFSVSKFEQVLSTALYSANEFIDLTQTKLLTDQPKFGVMISSFALPYEIDDEISLTQEQRNVNTITLSFDRFKTDPAKVSLDSIKKYYSAHIEDFKSPEQISLAYVLVNRDDLAKSVVVSDQQLKEFYDQNSDLFADQANQGFAQIKDRVKQVYLNQKNEENFANLKEKLAALSYEHPDSLSETAKELHLTIQFTPYFTKDKGGNDFTGKADIRELAFSPDLLSARNNSEVIQLGPTQLMVFRVNDYKPAENLSLDKVSKAISVILAKVNAENQTKSQAIEILNALNANKLSANDLSSKYQLKIESPGWVSRLKSDMSPQLVEAIFKNKPSTNGAHYSLVKVSNGFILLSINGLRRGDIAETKKQAYAQEVQVKQGILEYEIYKKFLLDNTKVKMHN